MKKILILLLLLILMTGCLEGKKEILLKKTNGTYYEEIDIVGSPSKPTRFWYKNGTFIGTFVLDCSNNPGILVSDKCEAKEVRLENPDKLSLQGE